VKMWEGRKTSEEAKEIVDDSFELLDETKQLFGETDHLPSEEQLDHSNYAINWFANRLQQVRAEVETLYAQFRLSEALKVIYSLIWDDFCSWYLEWVKPGFDQPIEDEVYGKTTQFFEELMQLLHPFMPFITEEIYHLLSEKQDDLCVKQFKPLGIVNNAVLAEGELLKQVISALRDARNKAQLKPKETIQLFIQSNNSTVYKNIETILLKQVNAETISYVKETVPNATVVAIEKDKFYIESERKADIEAIKTELLKDLEHQKGFLQSVLKKLSNERFVANAKPEVVDLEKKKQADAEARIKTIEETLANLV
jgi:valyl-tRNA synthetase